MVVAPGDVGRCHWSFRRRVLIVDDEPQMAAMLQEAVSSLGYSVLVAATGPDAIQAVLEFQPDVVLLDITLPGIPGDLVLECLHGGDPDLPIVMLTGNTDPNLVVYTLARGAFDYIAKPFNVTRLCQAIETALASRS
jgi:two-component system C4-dicarboxylate transport response regulator DctD